MSDIPNNLFFKPVRRVALETLGFEVVIDPDQPSDVISFRDENGKTIGRITGLATPAQSDGH